ncbi:PIG-L family deacetylase [Flammeovirgaceae bacterium SG7u.111]|nr:PIG-L family deacetylase [Flammeovirgaceae bacterium SG7u.132]WPO38542.1 PIG-L family deacetylase [Flammeovirgaceae bacterium SG7u.111]
MKIPASLGKALSLVILAQLSLLASVFAQAGPERSKSASEIKQALQKMQVVGTVLYVAAHPDDENTRMITYMANDVGVETAYLSLTRGDGGQNLIGKEVREQMGLIRTQELLAARRTDGGQQFFSRANDFGYSKHPTETLNIWDKEQVLGDAVWVIRKFRPDVIITRFSPGRDGKTHGHHTTSAKIALEAFSAAADPTRYPEQLKYVEPWQAKRIVWNTSSWFFRSQKNPDMSKYLQVDVGTFNPLLGKSHGEIAAASRSMHKSQGFGAAMQRGMEIEYLEHLAGDSATTDLFEEIDLTWARIKGSDKVSKTLKAALTDFDMEKPHESIPQLLEALAELKKLPQENHYVKIKIQQLESLIVQCAGIWGEASSPVFSVTPGDSLKIDTRIIKRSPYNVKIKQIVYGIGEKVSAINLEENKMASSEETFLLPKGTPLSQPYWIKETPTLGMFVVNDQTLIGKPENDPSLSVAFQLQFEGEYPATISLNTPLMYRWVDPVDGERYRPLAITPPVTANIEEQVYIYADKTNKKINVLLKSHTAGAKGDLVLELPEGWGVSPEKKAFELAEKGDELNVTFKITPPEGQFVGKAKAVVKMGGESYNYSLKVIDYAHIPIQTIFPPAEAKLAKLDIQTTNKRIGYIMGAGDAVPEALQQIGYSVDLLSDTEMSPENLRQYDAIIVGVRAYNTNPRLKYHQDMLMDFVEKGGNMIVQYNTSHRLVTEDVGPYPITLSRDRVTVEEAPVKFLKPSHEVLSYPNTITEADFNGWVQERGLYFPNKWDEKYEAILEMNDPGEDARQGSLLVTKYGEGNYIYTGLSFFRELPAGVPGAYRLLSNLIEYGKKPPLKVEKPR